MRVGYHELGGARFFRAGYGGQGFRRHELAKPGILESGRAELLVADHAGNAFHIDRNEDFQPLCMGGGQAPEYS